MDAHQPREKVQIGHYYLIQKDYAEARRWYDQATADFAAQKPDENPPQEEFLNPQRFEFFHFYCLEQLGEQGGPRSCGSFSPLTIFSRQNRKNETANPSRPRE